MKNLLSLQREPQKTDTMATMTATREGRVKSINQMIEQVPTRNLLELENTIRLFIKARHGKKTAAKKTKKTGIERAIEDFKTGNTIKCKDFNDYLEKVNA